MVTVIEAFFLGALQGVTEWLPVSSSGHLVLAQYFLGASASVSFDALLHFATFIVVVAYFGRDIIDVASDVMKASSARLKKRGFRETDNTRLFEYIIVASVPTGFIGFFFRDVLEAMYSDVFTVCLGLIVTGIMLQASRLKKNPAKLNNVAALAIGVSQGLAIIPGISRSGATIATALFLGIERRQAARFSFLILIPAAIGGIILEGGGILDELSGPMIPVAVGFLTSLLVGYASLNYLMKVVRDGKFYYFSYYVIPLGLIVLLKTQLF